MRKQLLLSAIVVSAAACATPQGAASSTEGGPFIAPDLPKLAGQAATCAGPREKTFALEAREAIIDIGLGMRFNAWTYNGALPGPTLEACEGDQVTITVENHPAPPTA